MKAQRRKKSSWLASQWNSLRFESRRQPLLGPLAFAKRVVVNLFFACVLIGISLAAGMAGYHHFERMPWIDAFTNAAMILSGMGPLDAPQTPAGKLFAGIYALYSGLALIFVAGLVLAPIVHRVMHRFHLETAQDRG